MAALCRGTDRGGSAEDWIDLAQWVDWLSTVYDLRADHRIRPRWPAHLGVANELTDQSGAQPITAEVDRSAIFNRALSASEVADLQTLAD